ncbi:amidohydrolase family protein [Aliisedimentitalea scapharcae]|uniref:Amidohydrolase family protein n=1 Tax=Aliisedimentitalea scapharcae TaxID=1524259 RepID=A0ABZ2Y039_9RHOB
MVRNSLTLFATALSFAIAANTSFAQDETTRVIFTNVHVFDGINEERIENANVLVVDNLIAEISTEPLTAANAQVIDGGGRTLMPGIIEGHSHLMFPVSASAWFNSHDVFYIGAASAQIANGFLMRGWTTVRDIGGPAMGLQRAIEDGQSIGPRIYASSAVIGQTSGHGDFRDYNDPHPNEVAHKQQFYEHFSFIADGPAEVQRAVREALRRGAVQIKLMAGGGVSSVYDPLYTVQYSAEELRAATEAAADYGTYVAVHAYNDTAIIRSIENGVKVIEHGTLMTEASAEVMRDNDIVLSPSCQVLNLSEEEVSFLDPVSLTKFNEALAGLDQQMQLAKEYELTVAFGTDMFGSPQNFENTVYEFSCRERYFSPFEVLRQATSINGELLAMTGERNPYPDGPLGVIEAGAYADIILVDGNPLDGTEVLVDYENNIDLIMKDGVIYKNTLN